MGLEFSVLFICVYKVWLPLTLAGLRKFGLEEMISDYECLSIRYFVL